MAKVTIEGFDNVKGAVRALFEEVKHDKGLLTDMATEHVKLTQNFNRAGESATGKKHLPLEQSWIDRKSELIAKGNNPSPYYSHGASNLTFTGQLLNAIYFKVNAAKGFYEVLIRDNVRKKYKGTSGKDLTNKQVADFLKKGVITQHGELKQRNILGVNKQIDNVLKAIVRKFLNKKIKSSIFQSRKG
jgi:hypothetical protein